LLALPADMQARFLRIAELLQDLGPQRVGLPHIRPLEGKLWEMRMQGRAITSEEKKLSTLAQNIAVSPNSDERTPDIFTGEVQPAALVAPTAPAIRTDAAVASLANLGKDPIRKIERIARAVYAAVQGRRLLVLHVFVKKTQATPRSALETARRRLEATP